jgi:hypothetical protein
MNSSPKIRLLLSFILFSTIPLFAGDFERDDMKFLAPRYPLESLNTTLLPINDWKPFPTVSNPDGLKNIPESVRSAHILAGEKALNETWSPLPATAFLEYVRIGNRSNFEKMQFKRREILSTLVLAELFDRKGRFLDHIVNGIWVVCEESFWGVPAHLGGQKAGHELPDVTNPYVDLFAAETGQMIAWIHYLLKPQLDEINPLIAARMVFETDKRILTPFLENNSWGYLGFRWRNRTGYERPVNNWNPWINSNVLACALLLEENPDRRNQLVFKAMDSIDNFTAPYPADGGCDEGPSYWNRAGGSLYDCLELLYSASDGKINIYDQPLVKNIGQYIYKTSISGPYFINFADASATMRVEAPVVYRFGKAIGDEKMKQFAALSAQKDKFGYGFISGNFGCLNRQLFALFTLNDLKSSAATTPYIRDVWFKDIQVMSARSTESSNEGFYLAAKGGHNDESHNHNDIGNFIIYYDGKPVIIDAGAQTYTRQTFSSHRYELWNNQSAYHNLPTINGVLQKEGKKYAATDVKYSVSKSSAELILDIANAYPADAHVINWRRKIKLNREKNIVLEDSYQLEQFIKPFTLNLLTSLEPSLSGRGAILFNIGDEEIKLSFNSNLFEPTIETIAINDSRMSQNWGNKVHRIVLTSKIQKKNGSYTITFKK